MMSARLALLCALILLAACGPQRRNTLAPPVDLTGADRTSLDEARQMDRIEQALARGDLAGTQQLLDEAFAAGLDHPRAYYQQGLLYARFGADRPQDRVQLAKAPPWLIRASEASPHWHKPRLALADAYMRLGRLASAEDAWVELDRLFPESAAGPYGRCRVALLQDRDDDARGFLREALDRQPDYPPALYTKSVLAKKDGDTEAQYHFLQRYLAEEPLDAGAFLELGNVQEQLGRLEDARRSFERSYELQPDAGVARRLGDLARRRGDERAAARWDAALGLEAPAEPRGEVIEAP